MPGALSFRRLVVARAGGACEYCRLLQDASGVTFHIEHVVPLAAGGRTALNNLALSCPGCNLAKASRTAAGDARGNPQELFSPRKYEPWLLGWHLHFALERDTGRVVPLTPIGEATVIALDINGPRRTFARKLQIAAGLIA